MLAATMCVHKFNFESKTLFSVHYDVLQNAFLDMVEIFGESFFFLQMFNGAPQYNMGFSFRNLQANFL